MSKVTYKSLHELVVNEIVSRTTYSQGLTTSEQLKRPSVAPLIGNNISDVTSSAIVSSVQTLLAQIIRPRIINGLYVRACVPTSSKIIVEQGSGVSYGRYYEVREDTIVPISFDGTTEIFYVVLFENAIMIEKSYDYKKLVLAKIVVPRPGLTDTIVDDREIDNTYNAFIVNNIDYYLHGDKFGNFEEDTIELLRENISPILADNLIGNIRLTEDLKITNTAGTLEFDSKEMRLKNIDDKIMMKLNKRGTFFYDSDGREMAKFTSDSARIGNIVIEHDRLRSNDFISESRGFEIRDDGYAEFQDVRVRGRISSSVFEYDKISSVGGKLYVGNSTVLSNSISSEDDTITVDTALFTAGDILLFKDGINEEYMSIVALISGTTYSVHRDLASAYVSNPVWEKGIAIISLGNTSTLGGFILLDAISNYSPFIDINERNSGTYNDYTTKVRLGNLSGITDAMYGALSGYGLYADNVYLKGKMYAPDIKTAIIGSRIELTPDGLVAYSSANEVVLKVYTTGQYEGNVQIGRNPNDIGNEGILWDSVAGTLCLKGRLDVQGTLSADCIEAGTLCLERGIVIRTSPYESGVSGCTVFDGDGMKSYDYNGCLKFCLANGHVQAEDIRLQDPNCIDCYSYLNSGALRFHDSHGDLPYANRISSGLDATGSTICLKYWKNQPNVVVGINTLYSYNVAQCAQNQQWSVYSETPICYCNSGDDYGYCFKIHAELRLASGQGNDSPKQVAWGTSVCTGTCTCQVRIRQKMLLWCNGNAPSNYYYGCLCYRIGYRKVGDTTWCYAGGFTYAQPHADVNQLKNTGENLDIICFPCMATWELCSICCAAPSWVNTGICATTCTVQTSQVTVAGNMCCCDTYYMCSGQVYGGCGYTWSYSPRPTWGYFDPGGWTEYSNSISGLECYGQCVCGIYSTSGGSGPVCLRLSGPLRSCSGISYSYQYDSPSSFAYQTSDFIMFGPNACYGTGAGGAWSGACLHWCMWNLSMTHYLCCISYIGTAQSCCTYCLHSTCEFYGTYCILDPTGVLNWLAIAYA